VKSPDCDGRLFARGAASCNTVPSLGSYPCLSKVMNILVELIGQFGCCCTIVYMHAVIYGSCLDMGRVGGGIVQCAL
jgi:hypothetical protein